MKPNELQNERGTVAVEIAVGMFFFFMMVQLIVFSGRYSTHANQIRGAAHEAARAASVEPDGVDGQAAAAAIAQDNLDSSSCRGGSSATLSGDLAPGGVITVTMTCVVDLSDLTFLPIPGSRTITYSASQYIDVYRGEL